MKNLKPIFKRKHKSLAWLAISVGLPISNGALADGFQTHAEDVVDTSNWECEYCQIEDGFKAILTANLANLDDDEYRFGHYTGAEEGTSFFFDSDLFFRDSEGGYFDLDLKNAGLESVALNAKYGAFGRYQFAFDFQQIPLRQYANLDTPFSNPGDNVLVLPNNWNLIDGSTPVAVNANWSQFNLGSDWRRLKLDWRQNANDKIDYKISFQRIEKQGLRDFSAAQIWNATYLPLPIDHQSDQLDARLSYQGDKFWTSINYQLFTFNNNEQSLRYANPFTSLVVGGESSQLAAEPDNKAYKIGLNFNTRFADNSWLKLRGSVGQKTQNESFLPYSTNSQINPTLPTDSLNGKVDTQDFSARLYSRISPKISLHAKYNFHDQDNRTEQLLFQPVVADTFIGAEVTNLPYDYKTTRLAVGGEWRFLPGQLLSAEFKQESKERNLNHIRKTDNEGVEGKLRLSHKLGVQLNLKASRFERDASELQVIDILTVNENPLMQRYNQADRDEDRTSFQLVVSRWSDFSTSINGEYIGLQYINSDIGLQENNRYNYGLDFNWHLNQDAAFSLYYLTEKVDVQMAASQNFSTPDWQARSRDDIDNLGTSVQWKNLLDKQFDLSFNLNRSEGESQTQVFTGSYDTLPDIASKWTTARLKLEYRYSAQWTFQLRYQLDRFDSEDYALDGVLPGTVSNLLTFGAASYNYDVNYLVAGFSYHLF